MRPKLSIVIPIHEVKGGADFLWRSVNALTEQSFQDFEIIITKAGKMAENTNEGLRQARGELIKILYLDDYLAHKDALKDIVEAFTPQANWLITGANNNPYPYYTEDILTGNNKLGSPSVLTIRNGLGVYFDEKMTWLLDCDVYNSLYRKYGEPVIIDGVGVIIGEGDHQVTHQLSAETKNAEADYLLKKYNG